MITLMLFKSQLDGSYCIDHLRKYFTGFTFIEMLKPFVFFILIILEISYCQAQNLSYSLNSSNSQINWKIKPQADVADAGTEISRPGYHFRDAVDGIVPGVVFAAYVAAGKEKNPDYADNIWKVDEHVYNRPFWYRTEFNVPENFKAGQRLWIHFDNTNRYADFFFNGKKLSGTPSSTKDVSGHMLRTKYDITGLLNKNGRNAVAVLITDADQKKSRDSKQGFGITASPTYLAAAGWDWMPYVPGRLAGITGNVYLSITRDIVMEDPWMRSELESNHTAYLSFATAIKNRSVTKKIVTLRGQVQPGNIEFARTITLLPGEDKSIYLNKKDIDAFVLKDPKLWWPNGYGEPNLYNCKLTVTEDGAVSDTREISFGIRHYEYRFEPNSAGWPVMTFYINGQKLFIKGGNWGMSEYLLRCNPADYETKVMLHKDLNYNMIRLWTGCVTDDAFYDCCDKYGIMVWDDFWLYVAYNDVANDEDFKKNALDKVKRLRNHPSIALWCGANETHPKPELDNYLRSIVAQEDHNDRMYKSSSNQDGLSGSGWWGNQPPKHHFETSGSNLAWNKPAYPYGADNGYGLRSEIGTATFPVYESIVQFIPKKNLWPLPTDQELKTGQDNVWNMHYFGKEASNANPVAYKSAVNQQFGVSTDLESFAEKAQYLNVEVMKGMYEAWNDKMWNDASGMLIWMSQSAYPSFVWQTYDYYYDATGAYWGAKKACEPVHIQWNASNNSVKVINTTGRNLHNLNAVAIVYNIKGEIIPALGKETGVSVLNSNISEAFVLDFNRVTKQEIAPLHFIKLILKDPAGNILSDNFYWRSAAKAPDYTELNNLPNAKISCDLIGTSNTGHNTALTFLITNKSNTIAFGNRFRLINKSTKARILPLMTKENYFTLMPGEERKITLQGSTTQMKGGVALLLKKYGQKEILASSVNF